MGKFVFDEIDDLESSGKLDAKEANLLTSEFDMVKAGYQFWRKNEMPKPWYAAVIPVSHSDYNDRLVLLARKRPNMLKDNKLKPVRAALEKLGFKVQWGKRVFGTIENSKDTDLAFKPDDGKAAQPSGFSKRLTVFCKGYKFQKLLAMNWELADGTVEAPTDEIDEEDDTDFSFMSDDTFKNIALEDIEDQLIESAADAIEAAVLEVYEAYDLVLDDYFDEELAEIEPGDETYAAAMKAKRSPEFLALLAEVVKASELFAQKD